MHAMNRAALAFALALPAQAGLAATCTAASAGGTTVLLELYTSEGCSSCPLADRWLSGLARSGLVPGKVVPLALHVDYWDSLGWHDRFSSAAFSRRQGEMVRAGGGRSVYTPQVLLGGRNLRDWHNSDAFVRAVRTATEKPAKAKLALQLTSGEAGAWSGELSGTLPGATVQAYVAVYENGLFSEVRAGENRGARLNHDYVVREWIGPLKLERGDRFQTGFKLPARADIDYSRAGVAAFLQDPANGEILQAVALAFCR